jgi:hypothetical protein
LTGAESIQINSTESGKKGALAPGQLADLAALSGDFFFIPKEEIKHVRIGPFEKGQESNLETLSFTGKRNGGNCYEHTNSNG